MDSEELLGDVGFEPFCDRVYRRGLLDESGQGGERGHSGPFAWTAVGDFFRFGVKRVNLLWFSECKLVEVCCSL